MYVKKEGSKSMSEATKGIKKKLSLEGQLARWVSMEAKKQGTRGDR